MNFIKTLNERLTKIFCLLFCFAFCAILGFAQTSDVNISIIDIVTKPSNTTDQYGYKYYEHIPKLKVDIQLPETGPGTSIENLSDIVAMSLDIEIPNFENNFKRDVIIDYDDFLLCNNADDFNINVIDNGVLSVQTFFSNGMTEEGGAFKTTPTPTSDCYQPPAMVMSTGMIIDGLDTFFHYTDHIETCMDNSISLNNIVAKITNAYFTLENGNVVTLSGNEIEYDFELPFTTMPLSELVSDFNRSWDHVCTDNDGSITIDWLEDPNYNGLQLSTNGGLSFEYVVDNYSYTTNNLSPADYDIIIKPENTCPFHLDDININDLSHEVTRNWGHPSCAGNDGWLELTWIKKALPKIDISINGGQSYTTITASNEFYRVENLPEGDYDIRVKWTYSPMACPTQLDDINIRIMGNCKTDYISNENIIQLYPNPANRYISINWEEDEFEESQVKIYNLAGKEIKGLQSQKAINSTNIDIGGLSDGIYIVKILQKNEIVFNQRLIKL